MSAVRKWESCPEEPSSQERLTPQEYLRRERFASTRSEYVRGRIYAMAGAKPVHNILVANIIAVLVMRLRGRPCTTYSSDQKVQAGADDVYFYPDVSVGCGEAIFKDGTDDVLINPALVVEVLSPATERYDKTFKFAQYALLPSLTEYMLISADRRFVQHYARRENGQWLVTLYSDANATVLLPSLGVELPLSEMYDRVEWETPA